jgi:hypothetical protein
MSRLMITAAPETNRWNEGQLIPETLISAMAQLVGEADYIHLSQLVAEHALRADNCQADTIQSNLLLVMRPRLSKVR